MFFLGLTGSLLPYLLLLGVVLTFTLATSQEALANMENKPDEKNISLPAAPETTTTLSNCYQFHWNDFQENQKISNQDAFPADTAIKIPYLHPTFSGGNFVGTFHSKKHIARFFGLSPPCLMN